MPLYRSAGQMGARQDKWGRDAVPKEVRDASLTLGRTDGGLAGQMEVAWQDRWRGDFLNSPRGDLKDLSKAHLA